MKKNTMMRVACVVLVAVMLSTCAISGTFAKYTSTVNSTDSARVAKWGFTATTIDITNLFETAYTGDNGMNAAADAIAPGTTNSDTFKFTYGGEAGIDAPEVAYSFTIELTGTAVDNGIKNNNNITWKLDNGTAGTWDEFVKSLLALAGGAAPTDEEIAALKITRNYAVNTLPDAFGKDSTEHTITWNWAFEGTDGDAEDTTLGNATELDDVSISIKITATQLDTYTAN